VMEWGIHQPEQDNTESRGRSSESASMPIQSEITLHFPRLGKVTAKLNVWGEHVNVQILAEQSNTALALKTQAGELSEAFELSGQSVESLIISTSKNL